MEIIRNMTKQTKRKFRENSKGNNEFEYSLLKDYVSELNRTNPGSTVVLDTNPSEDGMTERFKRLYVCFEACKRGYLKGSRKVVQVEGCFLKTSTKGQILTSIGRDPNNQMYPIA